MSFIPRYLVNRKKPGALANVRQRLTTDNHIATTEKEGKLLFGTVPLHRSYIFLHSSDPPGSFPARLSTPIQRALQLKASKWGGIVNFAWFEDNRTEAASPSWEYTAATAFSTLGGRLEIPQISLQNLDEVAERLRMHAEGSLAVAKTLEEVHLYVCTHGARDCRCGSMGGNVVKALRNEIARRIKVNPSGPISCVKVGEVGHVGGHQYAANLLVYPHGDWLGLLKPDDVPTVLSDILSCASQTFSPQSPPLSPRNWRGRMGLSKDEQLQLFTFHSSTPMPLDAS